MRIGIIAGEYPPMPGGVGAYTAILARHLIAKGHNVCVLSTRGAHIADVPLDDRLTNWSLSSLFKARQWSQTGQFDLVNIQFQTAAFDMSPWVHFLPDVLRPTPVVTTFHDLRVPYIFPKAGSLRPWIVKHLAQQSAGVIVTNHEDQQQISGLEHSIRIPIGSNILAPLPQDFDPQQWRDQQGIADDDFLLAYFGLINRSKGVDTLLYSLASLRESGVSARLLIIGGSAGSSDPTNLAYKAEVDRLIQKLDLSDWVRVTGYLDDSAVAAHLSVSDAVVLPFRDGASFRRGSLMAAIHYGAVIVTTQPTVDIPEFVDQHNMLFVPPEDTDSLSRVLRSLHETPHPHLRQGAFQLARHFNWEHITVAYISFFQGILQDPA